MFLLIQCRLEVHPSPRCVLFSGGVKTEQQGETPPVPPPPLLCKTNREGWLTLLMAFCPWGAHCLHTRPFREGDREGITWPLTAAGLQ